MKNYIVLFLFFLISCKKEDPYKNAYEQLVKEDIGFKEELGGGYSPIWSNGNKKIIEHKTKASKTYNILTDFLELSLNTQNYQEFNKLKQETLTKIQKLNSTEFCLDNLIDIFKKNVTSGYEKLQSIDRINFLKFRILLSAKGGIRKPCDSGIQSPIKLFLSKVNDSVGAINIQSKFLTNNPVFEEDLTLTSNAIPEDLVDGRERYIPLYNSVMHSGEEYMLRAVYDIPEYSYRFHSKSDTIRLKAVINTKKQIGIRTIDFDKEIIVGQMNLLCDRRYFYDTYDKIYEKVKLNPLNFKKKQDVAKAFAISLKNKIDIASLMANEWTLHYNGVYVKNLKPTQIDENIKLLNKKTHKSTVFNLKNKVRKWKHFSSLYSKDEIIFKIYYSTNVYVIFLKINDNFKIKEVSYAKK